MRRFAISDIHGCAQTFTALLQRIDLQPEDALFLLGDYIDRGPDSRGVLDRIFNLKEKGHAVYCLRGNHEQLLLNALSDPAHLERFALNGGLETMLSFRAMRPEQIPAPYLDFIADLPHYLEIPGYILVHAGLRFGKEGPLSHLHDMIWIRNWHEDIHYDWLGARRILHGHTPIEKEAILQQAAHLETARFLDIDAGCVYTSRPGMGHLCAFDLDSGELFFQENIE